MNIRKVLLVCAIAAVTALSAFMLSGCESSDEKAIRKGITAELEAIKGMDQDFLDLLAADAASEDFSAYGIDATTFMKKYLEGFDYSINDIKVDEEGASAVATVTLTCKSFTGFLAQVQTDSQAWVANAGEGLTQEDVNTAIGNIIMEAMEKVSATATDPISITYEKVDNTWQAVEGAEEAISMAMLTN